jgi:hypothetical protein
MTGRAEGGLFPIAYGERFVERYAPLTEDLVDVLGMRGLCVSVQETATYGPQGECKRWIRTSPIGCVAAARHNAGAVSQFRK